MLNTDIKVGLLSYFKLTHLGGSDFKNKQIQQKDYENVKKITALVYAQVNTYADFF